MKEEEWLTTEIQKANSDQNDVELPQKQYISIPPSVPHRRVINIDRILDPMARELSPEEKSKQEKSDERKVKQVKKKFEQGHGVRALKSCFNKPMVSIRDESDPVIQYIKEYGVLLKLQSERTVL
jgi:hypothetical protein